MAELNQYEISSKDIYNLIQSQNVNIPSGSIDTEKGKINVSVPGSFESIQDIQNLIIYASKDTGALVRLKDIANIFMQVEENTKEYRQKGNNAVLLTGFFEEDQNILLIGKEVRHSIDELKKGFPKDLKINEVLFQPEEVGKSVNSFLMNLLQGILLVVVVILIGMGIRNAIVVSATIPLTILITFIIMNLIGIDIQQISIAALIIALGILVDNSIVISDAIQVKINQGLDHITAAVEGTKESAVPVFTSTLTTIAAFLPLTVLPGEAGEFIQSLPAVVIISLIVSYLVAMLVTSSMGSLFFKRKEDKISKSTIRLFFEKMLKFGLKRKKTTITIAVLLFFCSISFVAVLNLEIFPYADKDIMYMNVIGDDKGDMVKTEEFITKVENSLSEEPEITDYVTAIGGSLPKFYLTVLNEAPSSDFGQIMIKFDLKKGNRFKDKKNFGLYLQEKLNYELMGGKIEVNQLQLTSPGPDIDVRISGTDRETINHASDLIENELTQLEGTYNVLSDVTREIYQYRVNIDTDEASGLGLTKYDIQNQINIVLNGSQASVLRNNGKEYSIVLESDIDSLQELENLKIKSSMTDSKILLKQIAETSIEKKLNTLNRYDRKPAAAVTGYVKPGYSNQDIEKYIENYVADSKELNDVNIYFKGEKEIISKYMSGLGIAAVFALLMIYVILLFQFNSLLQPLIILMTVPLSIIGSLAALFIFRQPISFTVGLGIASLIGIVVNNAILLIEYINRAKKEGFDVEEACIDSVDRRFRPIMLSTITTVIGLIPLATSGSSFFAPMAVALMGGLILSTVLTLIVIPTLYSLLVKDK